MPAAAGLRDGDGPGEGVTLVEVEQDDVVGQGELASFGKATVPPRPEGGCARGRLADRGGSRTGSLTASPLILPSQRSSESLGHSQGTTSVVPCAGGVRMVGGWSPSCGGSNRTGDAGVERPAALAPCRGPGRASGADDLGSHPRGSAVGRGDPAVVAVGLADHRRPGPDSAGEVRVRGMGGNQ